MSPPSSHPHSLRERRASLILAQQLMQEADLAEEELDHFTNQDRPAYLNWHKESFQSSLNEIDRLEDEHAKLVHFHNSIVALSQQNKLTMAQSLTRLRKEQHDYLNGGEGRRRRIEAERAERDLFIKREQEQRGSRREEEPGSSGSPKRESRPPTKSDEESEGERLKFNFRRLVRRLHPDLNTGLHDAYELKWQKKIWNLAQSARELADCAQLDRLYKLTLLRQMEFSDLSQGDIEEITLFLKQELLSLSAKLSEARQSPAYLFTLRSAQDRSSLARQIASEMENRISWLAREIDNLKGQHAFLEILGSAPRRVKPEDRREARTRRRRRASYQLSLFDF